MSVIFAVEDDPAMCRELATLLEKNGFTCRMPDGFEDLDGQILRSGADLVLLDLGLPGLDGLTVLRALRTRSDVPVLILTSRESDLDELMGMHYGADDYVTKPFNGQILVARVESILRRVRPAAQQPILRARGVTVDLAKGTVTGRSGTADLTKNEQGILCALMRREGEIVSRDELIEQLWQADSFVDDNTLTVNMTRLRGKLREVGEDGLIRTRRGMGYQI